MFKRIAFLATLVLLLFGWAVPARAEDPLRITRMDVSVWPEYDQPGRTRAVSRHAFWHCQ